MEEMWTDIYYYNKPTNEIYDYRGYYQVSNLGRVRSVPRTITKENGTIQCRNGKIKDTSENKDGYLTVCLSKDGKTKNLRRLYMEI